MAGTVAVVGASGWIGKSVMQRLPGARPVSTRDVLSRGAEAVLGEVIGSNGLESLVVVNTAGLKSGSREDMQRVNVDLVAELCAVAATGGGRVVHLGSAAEYGLDPSVEWVDATTPCQPVSDYGQTKYEGTLAALAVDGAAVLRLFNIASNPPQSGSPLEDICRRVSSAVSEGTAVELLSPDTRRDYVTRGFVTDSIEWAVNNPCQGIFNIASGTPVRLGDLAAELVALHGSRNPIVDLEAFAPTSIAADPQPWESASGLREHVDAHVLADLLFG